MKYPDFLIVGAPRAGTTALYKFLNQNPHVFMSPAKEPAYFSEYGSEEFSNVSEYQKLFKNSDENQVTGEASPMYLWDPASPAKIVEANKKIKIIAILRDPVERAWSHYKQNKLIGIEGLEFDQAINREIKAEGKLDHYGLNYCGLGHYKEQLQRYFSNFERGRIQVFNFNYFFENLPESFSSIADFLGVEPCLEGINFQKYNQSTGFKFSLLYKVIKQDSWIKSIFKKFFSPRKRKKIRQTINWWNRKEKEKKELSREHIELIKNNFIEDIEYLENNLNMKLENWTIKDALHEK